MARIRTIKPDFWTSEQVMDCKPLTRLLFIGLWNFADDYGRALVAPRTIKAQVMPGDDVSGDDVQTMLNELNSFGLISFYSADGKEYFEITGWKHQKIDNPSKYKVCPAPSNEQSEKIAIPSDHSPTIGLEGRGGERKVRENKIAAPKVAEPKPEKKSRSKPKVVVSDDFKFSHAARQYAALLGFSDSEVTRELQRFIRHAKQNDRRCADWDAAAHNWFDKAAEFAGKAPPRSGPAADDGMIEVLNEDQLVAWDRYATSRGAKTFPRNSRGGWRFPSRWPPGYSPPEESRDDPMPALTLQSMQ